MPENWLRICRKLCDDLSHGPAGSTVIRPEPIALMLVTGDYWPAALGDTINVGTSRRSCAVRPLSFETMTRFGPGSWEVPCMMTTLRQSRAAEGNPLEDNRRSQSIAAFLSTTARIPRSFRSRSGMPIQFWLSAREVQGDSAAPADAGLTRSGSDTQPGLLLAPQCHAGL